MDRRLLVVGGVVAILAATVALDAVVNWQHPVLEVKAFRFDTLPAGTRSYKYMKDGEPVGTFQCTVSKQDARTVIDTTSSVVASGKSIDVNTRLSVTATGVAWYSANATSQGSTTTLVARLRDGKAILQKVIQGEPYGSEIPVSSAFTLLDNNIPTHWELTLRGFSYEPGRRYSILALVPQQNELQKLELYVDEKPKTVTAGGVTYECTVIREVNTEVACYMSGGKLIQWRNEPLNIEVTLAG